MSATRAGAPSPRRLAEQLLRRVRAGAAPRAGTRAGGRVPAAGLLRRPQPRTLLLVVLALVLAIAAWFWVRDSSLVAVRSVEISGVDRDGQGARVRAALEEAARSMTTLHVRQHALDSAVAPFSLVKRIEVQTDFPHTLRVHVVTNVAVGAVVVEGRRIAVTSDGTLLRDLPAPASLPEIPLRATPAGTRVTEPTAVTAVAALAAAPTALRSRVESITTNREHGLTIKLSHGPLLWFGAAERLHAKWIAATAVLADGDAAGASTIDVTSPERPAVGGLPDGAPATGESDLPTLPEGSTVDPAATTDPAAAGTVDPAAATTVDPAAATDATAAAATP